VLSLYSVRRRLRVPLIAWRRHRYRHADAVAQEMLDALDYRRSAIDFFRATARDPDLRYRYDLDATSVILDVGGYFGEWAQVISRRTGARVHVFEPVDRFHRVIVGNLAEHPNVSCWPYGLGARDETIRLALEGPGSARVRGTTDVASVEGELRDVSSVLDELGIDHVDLCKINIEGGEYDLLERVIQTGWLPKIRQLQVQFHEWYPDAHRRRRRIRRSLRATHEQQWNYPWVFESWAARPSTS
jgi:FkbM family methyltransferase